MIPISGKVCKPCVRQFEDKFGKKQGEKIVIVMKSGNAAAAMNMADNTLAMPSPFVKQEPGINPVTLPPLPPPPPPPPSLPKSLAPQAAPVPTPPSPQSTPPPFLAPLAASTQRQRLTRLTTGALAAPPPSGTPRPSRRRTGTSSRPAPRVVIQ